MFGQWGISTMIAQSCLVLTRGGSSEYSCLLDCTRAQQSVDFTKVLVDFTKNSVLVDFTKNLAKSTIPYRFRTQRGRSGPLLDGPPIRGPTLAKTVRETRDYSLAKTVREARARAGETVNRRRLAATSPLGTAPLRMRRRDLRRFALCFASLLESHSLCLPLTALGK